jgi:hypothetical protein
MWLRLDMIRRLLFLFKQNYWRGLALTGVFLEILAAAFWQSNPRLAGICAGVGGSILATVIVTWAGPAGEEVYQSFLRLGVTRFWSDRSLVDDDQWVKWLKGTQMRCTLFGQAHGEWFRDITFEPALVERLTAGKNVEIFFLDPTGAGAALRQQEDSLGLRNTLGRIRASIKAAWDISERLDRKARDRFTIYVYDSTPSLGVTWIDDWMVVTHYLAGSINRTSPALRVEAQPDQRCLYAVYEQNVNHIRAKSIVVTKNNLHKYTNE